MMDGFALYWQVAHPDGQDVQENVVEADGLLVNPVVQVEHSIIEAVELYVHASHPVPQLAHCPAVAPNWYPVLHEVQVMAPVLLERVQVAQLDTPQESHVVLVISLDPY